MTMTQRNTPDTLEWYRMEQTSPPFDPDGMCLKICRTARNIDAMFPSALSAQQATPASKRITKVADITKGMILYYDDPRDSNPFGHIVTAAGWASEGRTLHDLIVWTNSVRANVLVAVRGDYFPQHWGDQFQFAATWLNGQDLLLPKVAAPKPPEKLIRPTRLRKAIALLEDSIEFHRSQGNDRIVQALRRDIKELRRTIAEFK